ncbi:MAG: NADP-dependent malic enzyme [Candidatus Sericytochromatia bacterium]|nr:NADP-dependent malic enzyme [Candidatus Sericytochromatia bacterium]
MTSKEEALNYHAQPQPGKLAIRATKPCATQRELSLAYTPGVAEPCREIAADPNKSYAYTSRGNLVGVISNGTAVLGLGNIGPHAAKPVMEGKAILFKRFADIDVFDIELDAADPDVLIRTVQALEPTFGGINLEDIKAPDCFYIEETLRKTMEIPVFHDDQHGTAVIVAAGLLNALEIADKDIQNCRIVFNGAGAAAIACANLVISFGANPDNILMCDSKGVIHHEREALHNPYKERFVRTTEARTLADAMQQADVFIGVSAAGAVSPDMIASMNHNPIVFALANPDPEITYPEAVAVRDDIIMATGRSDYPNQVNNVLGFPYIFRGALDVQAKGVNEAMLKAAATALAKLTREPVPTSVCHAYHLDSLAFGREYLIPKPFDPRILVWVASAVAEAAIQTGMARRELDLKAYRQDLERRQAMSSELMRLMISKAQNAPKRIVFVEGEHEKIIQAARILVDDHIAQPILLGNLDRIAQQAQKQDISLEGIVQLNPRLSELTEEYAYRLYKKRQRKGLILNDARMLLRNANYYAAMMVECGDADGLIAGLTQHYPDTLRPALQCIPMDPDFSRAAGLYMLFFEKGVYFLADATVNIEPSAKDLAGIARSAARMARQFDIEPRIALLSFSNYGSVKHPHVDKVQQALAMLRQQEPELIVDGEMQADTAVSALRAMDFSFSQIKGDANILIFPDLQSCNIAYKLLIQLGGAEALGPVLMGMSKPVHVLQQGASLSEIVNMAALAVVDAQRAAT